MNKFLIFPFLFLAISFNVFAEKEEYVKLSAAVTNLQDKKFIVLNYDNAAKWHTYWKNPGDAGLPIFSEFSINGENISPTKMEWPRPKKYIEAGNILAYGYENQYQFFFELSPQQISLIQNKTLNIYSRWLVCKEICIPGSKRVNIELDSNSNGKTSNFKLSQKQIKAGLASLPKPIDKPGDLEITLVKVNENGRLALHYTLSNIELENFDRSKNLLTPFPTTPLDFKHEELFYDSNLKTIYGRTYLDWDGAYQEPPMELPLDGIFQENLKINFLFKGDVLKIQLNHFAPTGDESFTRATANFKKIEPIKKSSEKKSKSKESIFLILLFAFLGGLILNLMPCVLPVISLKLFGLILHSDESKSKILKHNLTYTSGVIASFWVLALTVLLLKSSGEQIGWGFQLQSPNFVFSMLIMLLVLSMNMLGLFEFMTPGGRKLGNLDIKEGFTGDFLAGVLATILSTPCSAPFLGTALTFAFTTTSFNIFLIFTFVGIGLSGPFILTGFFPKLVSFLPKPGMWMEKFKNILGFTILITFVWLYDVLASLVDFSLAGIYLNLFFSTLFFAFYFRSKISKKIAWNTFFFILPLLFLIQICNLSLLKSYDGQSTPRNSSHNLIWKPWSTDKMDSLKESKNWAFIDFTATWCLTCKVNKKLVLQTDEFSSLVKKHKMKLLVGDWTRRDERITQFLLKYNIVGVPAYFIQDPDGNVVHLGETISISKIEKELLKK